MRDADHPGLLGQGAWPRSSPTEGREHAVKELEELVIESTEKEVMKVYLAEYVSQ